MTFEQAILLAGFLLTAALQAGTLFKLVWGGGAQHQSQFATLEKACSESLIAVRNELALKIENQSSNVGNVVANISDRIHGLELKAMEARALAAETYMRRDSYHKATDEFKRDVRDSHAGLKRDMESGFERLEGQLDAVSQSIEAGRRDRPGH